MAHHALVFVVVRGANAAEDEVGVHAFGVVDQIAVVKVGDGESFAGCGGGAKEIDALLDGETVGFLRVVADGDDEAIEEFETALDHPEVAISGWIERTSVNCGAHRRIIEVFCRMVNAEAEDRFLTVKTHKVEKGQGLECGSLRFVGGGCG